VRKSRLLAIVLCFAAFYGFLIKAALSPPLPSPSDPFILYSNQSRGDLRLVLKKSFALAAQSIDIWMYAATDPLLLRQLQKRAEEGLPVSLYFDKRGGTPPLPASLHPQAVKSKGLMHRKIVILDESVVFIGSANMTTSSLQLHDNLTLGIYDPKMARFLKAPTGKTYPFETGLLWLLPDPRALTHIISKIDAARSTIFIAMFTLTQKDLACALIRAKRRGVDVKLAIDRYTARGASKKALQQLSSAGIEIFPSSGLPLLHHKWAYIDQEELILGSTNWTEAAFQKNDDVLLFLNPLPPKLQSQIESIISALKR
jgi:phosphatidylserine/phosphatidylglycerophosphate/cardiolipin synthase-like enzyme